MPLRYIFTGIILATGAFAQVSSFPKPSYFREIFQPARPRVELKQALGLRDFAVGGKLDLSLKNYLALVMSNNTDIQLQLLSLEIPKNNIQMAFGAWDPRATASFNATRSTQVPTNATTAKDASVLTKSLSQPYSLSYAQTLPEGLNYTAQFSGQKSSSTNSFNNYNPSLTANLRLSVSQPLLQNRGAYVNRISLMLAQSSYKMATFNLTAQLLGLINNAETVYWNFILARESLHVAEVSRDTSLSLMKYAQQQLDLGALSPLDIYSPQQQLAAAEVTVSQARFLLAQAEDAVRHQIGADLDPEIRMLPVSLTESVDVGAADSIPFDREEEVQKALKMNPTAKQALQKLDSDDLGIDQARNGLRPNLQFNMSYQSNGTGGMYYPSQSSILGGGVAGVVIPGGIADALGQMFGFSYPTYTAGLTLTLPIRNRAASAAMATAVVQKRTDLLNLRNQEQAIRLMILNAVTRVDGAREQLKLAKIQQDFAQKNLDAENQKYQLGTDILQNVVLAQRDKANADNAVIQNQIGLRQAILNLYTQTGELLDERGIVVR